MNFFEMGFPNERLMDERIKAVAGVIVNRDKRILVGVEQTSKPATRKERGQLSIPMETLKPFEIGTEAGLTKALMTEISTSRSMGFLRHGLQNAGIVSVVPVEKDVNVAVLLMKWKGNPKIMPFEPPHPEEFSELRWIGIKTLLGDSFVRPYADTVLRNVLEINRKKNNGIHFSDLSFEGFIPEVYERDRQLTPDVEVFIPQNWE
jgi:hypothetical protein